jgi:hypothetical protein
MKLYLLALSAAVLFLSSCSTQPVDPPASGAAASAAAKDAERGPATEVARGGSPVYTAQTQSPDEWVEMSALEFEAGRKVKGKRVANRTDSGFNPFGEPFGGASRSHGHKGRSGGRHRCPAFTERIASGLKAMGGIASSGQVACYESLFAVESSCSSTVYHDPRKAHNPYPGTGLCAIEKDPNIRRKNRRGPNCDDVRSVAGQIRCCIHLMKSTHGNYFGTVLRGLTPRCS